MKANAQKHSKQYVKPDRFKSLLDENNQVTENYKCNEMSIL